MNATNTKRNQSISLLRVIATICIVFCPSFDYYGMWPSFFPDTTQIGFGKERSYLCETALDVFVLIAGFLYATGYFSGKYRDTTIFLKGKAKRLLIPYLSWSIILVVLFPQWCSWLRFLTGNHHLWFLLMLMGCFIQIRIIHLERLNYAGWGEVILLSIIAYPLISHLLGRSPNFFSWQTVIRYFYGFVMGCFLSWVKWTSRGQKFSDMLLLAGTIVFVLISFVMYTHVSMPIMKYVRALPIFVFLSCLLSYMDRKNNIKIPIWVSKIDKHCIGVYLSHQIVIFLALLYVPGFRLFMDSHTLLAPMILFGFATLVSLGLVIFLGRNRTAGFLLFGNAIDK